MPRPSQGSGRARVCRGAAVAGFVLAASFAPRAGLAEAPAAYAEALARVRTARRAKDPRAALRACRDAVEAAGEPDFGGPRTARAHAACAEVELDRDRPRAAERAYGRAARAAVHSDRARRKYLARRRSAATRARRPEAAKRVTELLAHDAQLKATLRRPRRSEREAERLAKTLLDARRAYRADRDGSRVRLADAARALVLGFSSRAALAEKLAQRVLKRPAPDRVAAVAWRALYVARRGGDPKAAAEAAIRLDEVRFAARPEAERRYARGRELRDACRALDDAEGAGACVRLQVSLRGYAALVDYSKRRRGGPLQEAELARVHADALPTLERCVLGLARDDPERYRGEELTFSWTIGNDGRPLDVEVRPGRHAEAAATCIEDAVAWFRYPRTPRTAERRNVRIPYRLD